MNYFLFNKAIDYQRGQGVNVEFDNTGIWIKDPTGGKPGTFLSRLLDTGEEGTVWHRLKAVVEAGNNMAVTMKLYGTDSLAEAKRFRKPEPPADHCLLLELGNLEDILLWEINARYVWLRITLWGDGEKSPKLCFLQLYFPKDSWVKYLPEIYQETSGKNPFLERYLAVFQTIYEEMDQKIRREESLLDLASSKDQTLKWLAGFMGFWRTGDFKAERLRAYLSSGAGCFCRRGTAKGILDLVRAYTGGLAWLGEWESSERPGLLSLYVPEQSAASLEAYQALLKLVREHIPADMEIRIVVLRPYVRLNQHTYLGINSRLNTYRQAATDGLSMVGISITGGRG